MEGIAGYLRYRVVSRRASFYFNDGFEIPYYGATQPWWSSIGTDATGTLNHWNATAGVPTIAANLVTMPAGATMVGGDNNGIWAVNVTRFVQRLRWNTSSAPTVYVHYWDSANHVGVELTATAFTLYKRVANVRTNLNTVAFTPVNNTFYWIDIITSVTGLAYTTHLWADSAGSVGAIQKTLSGSVAGGDVNIISAGLVALGNTGTAACAFGGAFSRVSTVYGTSPAGSNGNLWTPVVTSGEPVFAVNPPGSIRTGIGALVIENTFGTSSGAWSLATTLSGGQAILSVYALNSIATSNVSAGGLTTPNAPLSVPGYTLLRAAGIMTANPTINLTFSVAGNGEVIYDDLQILFAGAVITEDLPHPHQSSWDIVGMLAHNPGSAALGKFIIPLHLPGSTEFDAAKSTYDQLDYYMRVEAYLGYDSAAIDLGRMVFAGFITGITKKKTDTGVMYELTGMTDLVVANLSRAFPGDAISQSYGTGLATPSDIRILKNYLATNELGWCDNFNPFTASDYTSTRGGAGTVGTWVADTEDGFPVVKCSTGSFAVLIAKTGTVSNDSLNRVFAKASARIHPSADASNGGIVGLGISKRNGDIDDSFYIYARPKNGNQVDIVVAEYTAGVLTSMTDSSSFINAQDGEGFLTFDFEICTGPDATSAMVNGKVIFGYDGGVFKGSILTDFDTGSGNRDGKGGVGFPFLVYAVPATGTATGYFTNLITMSKFAADGPSTIPGTFVAGTLLTPAFSLITGIETSSSYLELWSRVAIREGARWRYTPRPFVPGVKTIGQLDLTVDPGEDLTTKCIFTRDKGNLKETALTANDDAFATGTQVSGVAGPDGAGRTTWNDIDAMRKYGVLEDATLFVATPSFSEQRKASQQVIANKVLIGPLGSKTVVLIRDPDTVDRWREHSRITIDEPELGIYDQTARVIQYNFKEGSIEQTVTLDEFSVRNLTVPQKRTQQGLFEVSRKFANR